MFYRAPQTGRQAGIVTPHRISQPKAGGKGLVDPTQHERAEGGNRSRRKVKKHPLPKSKRDEKRGFCNLVCIARAISPRLSVCLSRLHKAFFSMCISAMLQPPTSNCLLSLTRAISSGLRKGCLPVMPASQPLRAGGWGVCLYGLLPFLLSRDSLRRCCCCCCCERWP